MHMYLILIQSLTTGQTRAVEEVCDNLTIIFRQLCYYREIFYHCFVFHPNILSLSQCLMFIVILCVLVHYLVH